MNYKSEYFKYDLKSGLSVAALSLPIGVAYSELLGLPPESGIFTAIFALLCYFVLGSTKELIIGPDSAIVALLTSTIIAYGSTGSDFNVQFIMFTTIAASILLFIAGVLKLGFISHFLSKPILTGFLNGVAIVLVIGQLTKFTGVEIVNSNSIFGFFEFIKNIGTIHFPTLVTGLISLFLIGIFKHTSTKLPAALVVIVISIIAASVFQLKDFGITFTPEIESGFPIPVLPDFDILKNNYGTIIGNAAAIVLLAFTNTVLVSKAFAKEKNVYNADKEFFALGFADLVCGIFKGFPISGSSTRTTINITSGAKTKFSMVFAALTMLLVMLLFADEFSQIPSAVFAAIIIDAASMIFKIRDIKDIRDFSKKEFRVSVVCTLGVIFIGVLYGILIALILSIIQLIERTSKPHESEFIFDSKTGMIHYVTPDNQALQRNDIFFYRFNAAMLFFNSDYFRERLFERISDRTELKVIIIDATPINYIDITFRNDLTDIISELNQKNIKILICRALPDFEKKLKQRLVKKNLNTEIFYPDVNFAVKDLENNIS